MMKKKKSAKQEEPKEQLLSTDNYFDRFRQSLYSDQFDRFDEHECKIGIYGWRKKFLYILIILIATLVILNAALTLWIIAMLNFSMYGLGNMKVLSDGLTLSGNAFIDDQLFASSIKSRKDESLKIQSDENLTLYARNSDGNTVNKISIGNSKISAISNDFQIKGLNGQLLFSVNDKKLTVATETLNIENVGGLRFSTSIQTPLIQASAYDELKLISPQRRINIKAPMSIAMETRLGDFSAICLKDLRLKTKLGKITLEASDIQLRNLKTALPTNKNKSKLSNFNVFQLCLCGNSGKIFIVAADMSCSADETICPYSPMSIANDNTFMPLL